MLTKKYSKLFLEIYKGCGNDIGYVINNIIKVEEESTIELLNWSENEIIQFLKKADSKSPLGLNKNMVILRKFANLICEKENIEKRDYIINDYMLIDLINKTQLLSVTLSYNQYLNIKNQLDINQDGKKINVRDKLIYELAWYGLTNEDIKLIKVNDVTFEQSNKGWESTIINVNDKVFKIEDPGVTEDIKLCMDETYRILKTKEGIVKKVFYKESDYLIKPVSSGIISKKSCLNNPNITLRGIFVKGSFSCEGIDMEYLSLEDIRRSRIIYLLSQENEKFFNYEKISSMYNLKSSQTLYWLKQIAKEKYKPINSNN